MILCHVGFSFEIYSLAGEQRQRRYSTLRLNIYTELARRVKRVTPGA
jgi:hypothetical protein